MEILPDVPALYRSPGVPFVKPQLDLPAAVVLRPPALDVDGVWRKEAVNARVLLVQPHGEPLLDLIFALFLCFYIHILLLSPLGAVTKHQIFCTFLRHDAESRPLVEAQGRVLFLDGEGCS